MATIKGIDVSNWQAGIDWIAVASSGVAFSLAKASESTTYADTYFRDNWASMQAAGVARGAYHFARPDQSSPEAQAAWFLQCVGPLQVGDVLALDLEAGTGDLSAWALAWLQAVEAQAGCKPLLYSAPAFMAAHGLQTAALAEYGLWIADWGVAAPTVPAPWGFWAVWQISDNGSVPGVTGHVDMDVFNGTQVQFRQYGVPATPVPVPVPQKPLLDTTARLQLVGYVAGGSGVSDLQQWLGGYTDA